MAFQNLLDLVDWKGLGVEINWHKRSRGSTVKEQIVACPHCDQPKFRFQDCQNQGCEMTGRDGLQWLARLAGHG